MLPTLVDVTARKTTTTTTTGLYFDCCKTFEISYYTIKQKLLQRRAPLFIFLSPLPCCHSPLLFQEELVDPVEDEDTLRRCRQQVLSGGVVKEYRKIGMTRSKGEDGETKEEYDFNTEVNLGLQAPIWKEKYKPRKPRFFNRVHTVSLLFVMQRTWNWFVYDDASILNTVDSIFLPFTIHNYLLYINVLLRDLSGTSTTRHTTTLTTLLPRLSKATNSM